MKVRPALEAKRLSSLRTPQSQFFNPFLNAQSSVLWKHFVADMVKPVYYIFVANVAKISINTTLEDKAHIVPVRDFVFGIIVHGIVFLPLSIDSL